MLTTMLYNNQIQNESEQLIGSIVNAYQMKATITDRIEYCGAWKENEPQTQKNRAWFHLIESGQCLINTKLSPSIYLNKGDLIIFPKGNPHQICPFNEQEKVLMICGEFEFFGPIAELVLNSLPEHIILSEWENISLSNVGQIIKNQLNHNSIITNTIINKTSEVLFILALQKVIQDNKHIHGFLTVVHHKKLCHLLLKIHAHLSHNWTVEEMADLCCQSKSSFNQNFTSIIGESPMKYVHMLRMTTALNLVKENKNSIVSIAETIGFESEAAFRKSFKNFYGFAPGFLKKNKVLETTE